MRVPAAHLKTCAVFANLTDAGLEALATIARVREVGPGMSVFVAGASGDALFLVDQGVLEVVAQMGGKTKTLCTLGAREHFGEIALLRPGTRAVTVRAKEAARLVEFRRAEFNALLKQKPQICLKVMLNIIGDFEKRVRAVQPDLVALTFN